MPRKFTHLAAFQPVTTTERPATPVLQKALSQAEIKDIWKKQCKKSSHPEDDLQRSVMAFISRNYPHIVAFHCPNGGARSKTEAKIFKSLGVMPGVADVIILNYANAIHPVIFVELKATTKQSPTQKEFQLKDIFTGRCSIILNG